MYSTLRIWAWSWIGSDAPDGEDNGPSRRIPNGHGAIYYYLLLLLLYMIGIEYVEKSFIWTLPSLV